jgi:Raf kinase inhibitor-like YbhB/YbcL family protein
MRLSRWAVVAILILGVQFTVAAQQPAAPGGGQRGAGGQPTVAPMRLTSTSFPDGGQIPVKYSAAGDQLTPAFTWTNVPPATVSFVLHMHDMENSRNKTTDDQLHWLVWNIPASTTSLSEGVPKGPDLKDGSHQTSATGPGQYRAPGANATGPFHHYVFELYALDTKIDVPVGTEPFETRASVLKAIQGHILGKSVYMGLFRRPQ